MDFIVPPDIHKAFPKNELDAFKIPSAMSKCACSKKKIISKDSISYDELVLDTAFNQGAHLAAFNIIKLTALKADFKVLNILLNQAMIRDNSKVLPLPKFYPLLECFCRSFLKLHPPCEYHTFNHYLQIFEEDKFIELFTEMSCQLQFIAGNVLPDSCQRRKIRKKFADEISSDYAEIVEKIEKVEEKLTRRYNELPPAVKLSNLFSAFSILVEILKRDFEVWFQRLRSGKTTSKFYRPLIVHLLWKDVRRFDEDAILNNFVCKIFKFYTDCIHNQVSAKHTKVVGCLINLISKVVDVIGRHQEAKPEEGYNLAADFKNLHYQPKFENSVRGFALKEIENGRRKMLKPLLYHLDETTAIGSICRSFANAVATALGRCTCKDVKECLVLDQAFIFMKTPWLLYLTALHLLKHKPGLLFLKVTATEALSDDGVFESQKERLRLILLDSALDTLRMLGYRTSIPGRELPRISKRIKLDPADLNNADDVEDIIALIRSRKIMTD